MTSPPTARVTLVQLPRPAQNYGPGKEPQGVRDAWDAHLHSQHEPEPEAEAEAGLTRRRAGDGPNGSYTRRPRPLRQNPPEENRP